MSQEKLQPVKEENLVEQLQAIRRKHIGSIPPPAPMEIFDPEMDATEERPPSPPVQITAKTPLRSHRRILGRPITLSKRAARKPFLWMLEPITRQINPVLNAFQSYFESHEERFVHTNRRMDQLEQSRIASEEHHRQMDSGLDQLLKRIDQRIDGLQKDSREQVQDLRKEILGELEISRSETEHRIHALQDASAEGLEKMDQLIEERISSSRDEFTRSLEKLEDRLEALSAGFEDHLDSARDADENRLHRLLMLDKMKIEERLARLERKTTAKMPPAQESRPIAMPEAYRNFDSFLFESKFRGERETITRRQMNYVEHFQGCQRVLDIGCGRGEFLQLLKENGIGAEGVDLDADAVAFCNELQLNAHHADAIAHLRLLPPESLDGIFCAQMVEHLTTGELIELIDLCCDRLKPGGVFLAETLNPASLSSLEYFYQDPTHVRPVAPETLEFLLSKAGLGELDIRLHREVEDERKLQEQPIGEEMNPRLQEQIRLQNENIARLNRRLFGPIDYSIMGRKPV